MAGRAGGVTATLVGGAAGRVRRRLLGAGRATVSSRGRRLVGVRRVGTGRPVGGGSRCRGLVGVRRVLTGRPVGGGSRGHGLGGGLVALGRVLVRGRVGGGEGGEELGEGGRVGVGEQRAEQLGDGGRGRVGRVDAEEFGEVDAEQQVRLDPVDARGGAGVGDGAQQLGEGVGASLGRGAAPLWWGVGRVGLIVGVEQDEQQLGVDLLEPADDLAEAVEAGAHGQLAARVGTAAVTVGSSPVVAAVVIDVVGDAPQRHPQDSRRHRQRELDEGVLVLGDRVDPRRDRRAGDRDGVGRGDVAAGQRLGQLREGAQPVGGLHPAGRLAGVEAGRAAVPLRRVDRSVEAVGAAAVDRLQHPQLLARRSAQQPLLLLDRVQQRPVVGAVEFDLGDGVEAAVEGAQRFCERLRSLRLTAARVDAGVIGGRCRPAGEPQRLGIGTCGEHVFDDSRPWCGPLGF